MPSECKVYLWMTELWTVDNLISLRDRISRQIAWIWAALWVASLGASREFRTHVYSIIVLHQVLHGQLLCALKAYLCWWKDRCSCPVWSQTKQVPGTWHELRCFLGFFEINSIDCWALSEGPTVDGWVSELISRIVMDLILFESLDSRCVLLSIHSKVVNKILELNSS